LDIVSFPEYLFPVNPILIIIYTLEYKYIDNKIKKQLIMKIKKFNELFDTEELRDSPENELIKLTGDSSYSFGKKIDYDFKTENIGNFITKISDVHYPFMRAFSDATISDTGDIKFGNFKVYTKYDEDGKYYNLISESKTHLLILGIKINAMNNYDIYVYVDDISNKEELETFEEQGVTYMDVISIIDEIYLPKAKELGLQELINYNFGDFIAKNN